MSFKVNEGKAERAIRVVISILLLAIGLLGMNTLVVDYTGTWAQWVVYALSAIMLFSGLSGICPLYSIIGFFSGKGWICPTCSEQERAQIEQRAR